MPGCNVAQNETLLPQKKKKTKKYMKSVQECNKLNQTHSHIMINL